MCRSKLHKIVRRTTAQLHALDFPGLNVHLHESLSSAGRTHSAGISNWLTGETLAVISKEHRLKPRNYKVPKRSNVKTLINEH